MGKEKKGFFSMLKEKFSGKSENDMFSESVYDEKNAMACESGEHYEGKLKNGLRNGKGTMTYASGNIYTGNWKKGMMHGKGEFIFNTTGERYVGEFSENKISGKGKFWHKNGAVYQGEYKNGKREGKGVMTYADGGHYEGEWFADKKNGHGKEYYAKSKIYYEGNFQMGLREGYGVMKWPDGHTYKGNFSRDKMNGFGVYDYGDGRIYKGIFVDDQRTDGEFTHKDNNGNWVTERYVAAPKPQQTVSYKKPLTVNDVPKGNGNLTITLVSYPASRKVEMIKHVREITGLGLKEAKDIVESVPKPVMKNASKIQADAISSRLKAVGGVVDVR